MQIRWLDLRLASIQAELSLMLEIYWFDVDLLWI